MAEIYDPGFTAQDLFNPTLEPGELNYRAPKALRRAAGATSMAVLTPTRLIPKKASHRAIALDALRGLTRTQLAVKYGLADSTIHQKQLAAKILQRKEMETIDVVSATKVKAVERVHQVIFNDELAETAPFAMFDRAARFLKDFSDLANNTPNAPPSQTITVNQITNETNNTLNAPFTLVQQLHESMNWTLKAMQELPSVPTNVEPSE
jgi:uncharacterized protein (DUF1810 family)